MRVEGDIVIERPIEEVFDFVADECNEPQYNPRMTRAQKISSGPIGVGTRFRSVMTGVGGAREINIEFTEYDRPRRITEKVQLSSMDINGALFFEAVPEGTRMKWIWDLEPHGFYKLLGPLVRRIGERQERTIWTSLKHLLEAQPRPSQGRAVIRHGHAQEVDLVELPVDERPPIIRAYLHRAGWSSPAQEARHYFGLGQDSSLEEIQPIVERYPVFRIADASERQPGREAPMLERRGP